MIVTEQEATTKRCQESFGPAPINSVCNAPMSANGMGQAWYTSPPIISPINCIGSACMAWCWRPMLHNARLDEITAPRKGYCGKAGPGDE